MKKQLIKIMTIALLSNSFSELYGQAITNFSGYTYTFNGCNAGTAGNYGVFYGCNAGGNNSSSGNNNSFIGYNAGLGNISGSDNTCIGVSTGFNAPYASQNTMIGSNAGFNNTASGNSFLGFKAGYSNTTGGNNQSFGSNALYSNTTSSFNAAFGSSALVNSTGGENSSFGAFALQSNTSGTANTGVGQAALDGNTTGSDNSAFGYYAGQTITTGSNNTCIGSGADVSSGNATTSNLSAFGTGSINNQGTNSIMFGVAGTKLYDVGGGNFQTSDGRFKTNVKEDVKGLAFINKLRPVTYNMDTKKLDDFITQGLPDSVIIRHRKGLDFAASTAETHAGFIAQEVEKATKDAGFVASIVSVPADINKSNYALNYTEIVVPLVKAAQELSHKADTKDSIISALQKQINQLLANSGSVNNTSNTTTAIGSQGVNLSNFDVVVLNQNAPNPFAEQTTITYLIPQSAGTAQIMFYDMSGKQVKSTTITTKGKGSLTVYANDLSNGTYSYTLIVDGKIIDTKQMIKQQ